MRGQPPGGSPTGAPTRGREAHLIELMRARVPGHPGVQGPGDDCAALPPLGAGGRRVLTTDALVEGVHFLRAHPPRWLGYKALAVNTSDVAAMGAIPEGFVLAAALPRDTPDAWWAALAEGLGEAARDAGCALAGGDVVGSPGPVMLTVTAWGTSHTPTLLRRDAARPGHEVWLAGAVGRSRRGLARWLRVAEASHAWPAADAHGALGDDPCLRAHLRPLPPLAAGPAALRAGATAGMDVSDGLLQDATRLGRASGVVIVLNADALPSDPALEAQAPTAPGGAPDGGLEDALERLRGGEDYALLVTAPPRAERALREAGLHRVGTVRAPDGGVAGVPGVPGVPGVEVRWGHEVIAPRTLWRDAFDHFG